MGPQDAPAPGFEEGEVSGYEFNATNGRRYTYQGHFLGGGTVTYRARVLDARGEYRGEIVGTLEAAKDGGPPRSDVDASIKRAIRESIGYRP